MGSFADYIENKLIDHAFGAVVFTPPATLYMGLSTTTLTDAGGNITEPSGNNYSRAAITNNTTNFPLASGGVKTNGADITFPVPSGNWGSCVDFFFSDAASGGNIVAIGTLTNAQSPQTGNTVRFSAGSLSLSLA